MVKILIRNHMKNVHTRVCLCTAWMPFYYSCNGRFVILISNGFKSDRDTIIINIIIIQTHSKLQIQLSRNLQMKISE